jgi:hypothetical protein
MEKCITESFLTSIFKQFDTKLRDVVALPAKFGGLSIFDPTRIADNEYEYSTIATEPLVKLILEQAPVFELSSTTDLYGLLKAAKAIVSSNKTERSKAQQSTIMEDPEIRSILKHQIDKGASLWLTTLPIANLGFVMNKTEFMDALCLRYNLKLHGMLEAPYYDCRQLKFLVKQTILIILSLY